MSTMAPKHNDTPHRHIGTKTALANMQTLTHNHKYVPPRTKVTNQTRPQIRSDLCYWFSSLLFIHKHLFNTFFGRDLKSPRGRQALLLC